MMASPLLNIISIYTADPADPSTPKNSFRPSDGFSIVMDMEASQEIVEAGLTFDAIVQLVNPSGDANSDEWYMRIYPSDPLSDTLAMTSIDYHWDGVSLNSADISLSFGWERYTHAVSVLSPNCPTRFKGVFFIRGSVNVRSSDIFAVSDEFWYKVGKK
jgi:hypothetical protein